jgi:hypothetical protein
VQRKKSFAYMAPDEVKPKQPSLFNPHDLTLLTIAQSVQANHFQMYLLQHFALKATLILILIHLKWELKPQVYIQSMRGPYGFTPSFSASIPCLTGGETP